ncbi:MAG: FliM/FliN family flagellar motor switch protein [Planctomycetota bacterium]
MPASIKDILQIEVPVIVQIAERGLSLHDVTHLTPGAIIELPKNADEQLEILVNNKVIGKGRAVKVGENFGIHVQDVNQVGDRIQAMGGSPSASAGAAPSSGDMSQAEIDRLMNEAT